jgi:hypothetical protein
MAVRTTTATIRNSQEIKARWNHFLLKILPIASIAALETITF